MCDNCLCVFAYVHTHSMDKSDPPRCSATDIAPVDSNGEHQVLEDDYAYSTVDDMQQQMFVAIDNPAYSKGLERSQQPAQQHYDQEMVTHGLQAHGASTVQLKGAASAK